MKKKYDDSIDYINGYPISEVWGTYHYLAREIAPKSGGLITIWQERLHQD